MKPSALGECDGALRDRSASLRSQYYSAMLEFCSDSLDALPDGGQQWVVVVGEDLYQDGVGEFEHDFLGGAAGGEALADEGEVCFADAAAEACGGVAAAG